jgi:glycosyltransferase involved in cell wall biosynthesis
MSAPIRVLAVGNVYPPHHLGGYEIIERGVNRALRADGHEVRVLATVYRRTGVPADAAEDPDVHRELEWYWHEHAWRRLGVGASRELERRNAERFDAHLRWFAPDVVAWWALGGMSLGLIERARRAGVPSILFLLDYWPSYGPQRDRWMHAWARLGPLRGAGELLTGLPTRVDLAAAGEWVYCSHAAREHTLAGGIPLPDGEILTPGVADSYLRVPREPSAPSWRWRLLYVGRIVEQKGVRTAIASLPSLPGEATLTIVGDGDPPYRAELERLAARIGVAGQVRFEPARPHERLIELYRDADAVVFPVEWGEPWGLVPLEAMALGRPVVATGRGGSGEYLDNERNALLFAAGDRAGLVAALRRLGRDPELRERLRAGGFATAEQHSEARYDERAVELVTAAARRSGGRR